ncbi:MAG: ABC transporter permease [Planctomycetia bacterium]|nr:ABC transporter permease [Planctomycetia bacterium]
MLGPIFVREWRTLPRRPQHYGLRSAYLGLLLVLGLTAWQVLVGWSRPASLGETARFGVRWFRLLVDAQLILLVFFSAVSAALSIAHEKDRRTFVLLLLTDLHNYEIVLGKLFGSLLEIGKLLLGALPVLALSLLLGGVAPIQALEALLIVGAACIAAGSLGSLLALWREQTFQALALTVLCLVLYVCLVRALDWLPLFPANLTQWLDPWQCLQGVLSAEVEGSLTPALGFGLTMLLQSVVLNGWAILRLRRWNTSGEPIQQREQTNEHDEKVRAGVHAAPGRVRSAWDNPILWREVRTRAYGRRLLFVKLAYFLAAGLIGFYALDAALMQRQPFAAAQGLLPVTIVSLLLIGAQAVTAITTERDKGALDLLLVTDLTPREFIFGKLGGIAYNAKEYLLPPLILLVTYAWLGRLATPPHGHDELTASRNVQALVCILAAGLALLAFVAVLGMHIGLRTENSRTAVSHTLGTVFFLSAGTLGCIYLILISGRFEYQWGSFLFFAVAGVGGLWWVLNGERPTHALLLASIVCPFAVLYTVMNVLIGKPGTMESSPPFLPALVLIAAFGFAVFAMLMPLLSEFDVALGRTTGGQE